MPQIQIDDIEIPLMMERSQGRRIRLRVHPESLALVVRTPNGKLSREAKAFIEQKEKWILKTYLRLSEMDQKKQAFWEMLRSGEMLYLGEKHRIRVFYKSAFQAQVKEGEIHLGIRKSGNEKVHVSHIKKMLRLLAKEYLVSRTQDLAEKTDSELNKIFVKDQKTKWGSCSGKRNVNLNWHLILLPPPLVDYLIIHELMHLREMNHSPAFWQWVGTYYPAYKQAQKALHGYDWVIGVLDRPR